MRNQLLLHRAQRLRKSQTNPEAIVWNWLRSKQMLGLKFRRQHPIGNYILDFYCPEKKIGIELDGSQHGEEVSMNYDIKRSRILQKEGITIIRFWNDEIVKHQDDIYEYLEEMLRN